MKTKRAVKKSKAPVRAVPYGPQLNERLKDIEYAVTYLANSWDASGDPEEEFEVFLTALEDVVRAHGIQFVADQMDMTRDALYKIFTDHKSPKALTLLKMLKALGLSIEVVALQKSQALKRA